MKKFDFRYVKNKQNAIDVLHSCLGSRIEVRGFFSCSYNGCFVLSDIEENFYYIEIFSPGLEGSLPKPPFRFLGGGKHSILEEVIICGVIKKSTSSRGVASLSHLKYIKVKHEDGSLYEYQVPAV